MRSDVPKHAHERRAIEQIRLDDANLVAHARKRWIIVERPPHDADDVVPALEEEFRQV